MKIDKEGQHNPLWSEDVSDEYEKRTKCFIRQYDKYAVKNRYKVRQNFKNILK